MGDDPVSGKPMVIKDGRFGPYVTDGETNASLRKGDSIEELTDEIGGKLKEISTNFAKAFKARLKK